jgi:hypothetical protein
MLMIQQRLVYLPALKILGLMLKIAQERVCLDVPTIVLAKIQQDSVWEDVTFGALLQITPLLSVLRHVQKTHLLILVR